MISPCCIFHFKNVHCLINSKLDMEKTPEAEFATIFCLVICDQMRVRLSFAFNAFYHTFNSLTFSSCDTWIVISYMHAYLWHMPMQSFHWWVIFTCSNNGYIKLFWMFLSKKNYLYCIHKKINILGQLLDI